MKQNIIEILILVAIQIGIYFIAKGVHIDSTVLTLIGYFLIGVSIFNVKRIK